MGLHFYLGDCPPRASGGALIGNMTPRGALLRGKVDELLTDGEKLMMSLMRLGILRTTAGVAEVDEAARAQYNVDMNF